MYFHVFCQIFNQLYDLYANLMNFFLLIFSVLFISSSDRVERSRAVSTKLYAVEFRPRTFYSNVYHCYHYNCFARCGGRAILFLSRSFSYHPNCINSKILSSVLTIHLLRQLDKEVFFFFGNKKELYALAITKPIDKKIDFSDDS